MDRRGEALVIGEKERWRLVLGRFAEQQLPNALSGKGSGYDEALDYLYSREYRGRGVRGKSEKGEGGGLEASQLTVTSWLTRVRDLFPRETAEVIQRHALERYGMTELLTDPRVLERLEPNYDLMKTLLSFRGSLKGEVLTAARRIIRDVVEELRRRLEHDIRRTLSGRLSRQEHSSLKIAQNLDWRDTIRRNLKHWDRERKKLIVQQLRFFSRVERRLPWTVILCVDQSASMTDSVIHSAVMAGILHALPSVKVKLVAFDTSIIDLSDRVDDPVEVLLSVQLGGGTNIGKAMRYCEQLVENPTRTIVALISDFEEGGSPAELLASVRRLSEARVRMLGLASLDDEASPSYDIRMAERLADDGMEIAALTPRRLAEWLARVIR